MARLTVRTTIAGLFLLTSPLQYKPSHVTVTQSNPSSSSRHLLTSMKLLSGSYVLVLLTFVPQVPSLPFNPVSMKDSNKVKEYVVGTALLVCTTASLLASTLCMYWFCRMEKRFRHRWAVSMSSDTATNTTQIDHDTDIWRPYARNMAICICHHIFNSWNSQNRKHLLSSHRISGAVRNANMRSVALSAEVHRLITGLRLCRPHDGATQRDTSLLPVNACQLGWAIPLPSICLCWSPHPSSSHGWLSLHQPDLCLCVPRRILHASSSAILVPFGTHMGSTLYHYSHNHRTCHSNLCSSGLRVPRVLECRCELPELQDLRWLKYNANRHTR